MPVTRPRCVVRLIVPILLIAALVGCGAQGRPAGPEASADTASGSKLPAAEGRATYPMTLKSPWGETKLEQRPRRIAAMGRAAGDAELLAALGVTPVAAPSTIERSVWTTSALRDGRIEHLIEVDPDAGAPVEAIAAADPDLIIASGDDLSADYSKLAAIAPVLAVESADQLKSSWRDRIVRVGIALDLEGAAKKAITDHDAQLEKLRRANPQFAGRTATYAILYGDEYGLAYRSTPGSDTEKLLQGLGFRANPLAEKFVEDDAVSMERLSLLDADVLLLSDNSENGAGTEMQQLTSNQLWTKVPAVAENRTVVFQNTGTSYRFQGKEEPGNIAWATSMSGPLADVWAADRLVSMLTSVLPAK